MADCAHRAQTRILGVMRRTLTALVVPVLASAGIVISGAMLDTASAEQLGQAYWGPYTTIEECTDLRDQYREMGGLAGNCAWHTPPSFPRGPGYYFPVQDLP